MTDNLQEQAVQQTIEHIARTAYGRLVAWLAAQCNDVALAEDALAEAFSAALRVWPEQGVPQKPESWLLTTARRRLIDHDRHQRVRAAAVAELVEKLYETNPPADVPDERLLLLFVCAHPAIHEEARAPLMLQTVLGLDAARIAASWLTTPATMSQRLVRAKTKIREAGIRFRLPDTTELPSRIEAVLEAIYAAYGTGWEDIAGTDERKHDLTTESIWLARVLREVLPGEPEVNGLLALLLYCESRRDSRRDTSGNYIPLSEQNPKDWNLQMIQEAEQLLATASRAGRPGRFQWLAAIQSAHAQRAFGRGVDWRSVLLFHDALLAHGFTLGIFVSRVAAIAQIHGATAALSALDEAAPAADAYQPYWVLRAHLLNRLDRKSEAAEATARALALTRDSSVRAFLTRNPA